MRRPKPQIVKTAGDVPQGAATGKVSAARRFGEQRPIADVLALALLLIGFSALAAAIFYLRESIIGVLLPVAFIAGAVAGLRTEVRELELQGDRMIVRTFFSSYTVPRANVTGVVITERGVAMDVLNGSRYPINPPGIDPAELHAALREWLQISD